MTGWSSLSADEKYYVLITLGAVVALVVLAFISAHYNLLFWLGVSVGGIGGLFHELFQSGGTILFPEKKDDGLYIGSIVGLGLGALAGIITVKGYLLNPALAYNNYYVTIEILMSGLALKGVGEAIITKPSKQASQPGSSISSPPAS